MPTLRRSEPAAAGGSPTTYLSLIRPAFWGAHALVVLAVAAAVGLGLWQLGAWQAQRDAAARDLSGQPAVPLASVMGGDDPFPGDQLGAPVEVAGRWLGQDSVYISDRLLAGRRGYWVVTPVLTADGSAMPVVRGWSPRPSAPDPTGPVELTGSLQASEGTSAADPDPLDDVLPEMRVPSLVEKVREDLYSGYVVAQGLRGPAAAGLAEVTPDSIPKVSSTTGLRNLLYAIQWWVFGGFAIYIWLRWCRDQVHPPADPDVDPDADPDADPRTDPGTDPAPGPLPVPSDDRSGAGERR